ncbi:MAG TPA: hypothetical protein VL282_19325 [Tepidisphaeraceae bacterium]|nr:hypothetical protein [Tepidisphaeraceae bacterium]
MELPESEANAVASLRLRDGILACRAGGRIWLRGEQLDDDLEQALHRLAPLGRYELKSNNALVPAGNLLPFGQLPDGPWIPLSELLQVPRTPAALPARAPAPVALRIVRSTSERPASLLQTSVQEWSRYARSAPLVRLWPLQFAASAQHVLIRGTPLPPLPGLRYYESQGVAVPCGFGWSPAADVATLRRVLGLDHDDLALFDERGNWQRISALQFVQARRSAVRLTLRGMSDVV